LELPVIGACSISDRFAFRRFAAENTERGVRNRLWKSTFIPLMLDFGLDLPRLASFVHSLLCDFTPIRAAGHRWLQGAIWKE
jgi:hypothetical protein